jgi:hypothetical protein
VLRIGYSYLYSRAAGYPPDWFTENLRDYMENFLPAYAARYLHANVVIESAPYAAILKPPNNDYNWIPYLNSIRGQVTQGYDSFVAIVDAPFDVVHEECGCAGENFYSTKPNFAWTSVRNWNQVERLGQEYRGTFIQDKWYAESMGAPDNVGIRALEVAGHETIHFILLKQGGVSLSSQIDGGPLTGTVFLDEGLVPVAKPTPLGVSPPNWRYPAQRIVGSLPYQAPMGGYSL